MVLIVAAMAASIGAGLLVENRLGERRALDVARRVLTGMFWVLLPFVTFFTLARLHITKGVGAGLVLAYAELAVVGWAAWLIGTRFLRLARPSVGALIVVVVVVNTGYLGLPLVTALLGTDDLPPAIAFDSLVSGPMFYVTGLAVGAAFGTRAGQSNAERLRTYLLRNPPLVAAVAGLLAPASVAPDLVVDAVHVVIYVLLVTGFFALGINLAAEAEEGFLRLAPTRPVAVAVVLRLVVAPALLAGLSAIIIAVPHAYLFQAAMPSGINSLVVAHNYGLDLRLTSSALAWTTGLAIVAAIVAAAL
jgi:malate permease and related proteins